ncbi:hypothetical protein BCR36DRAFT_586605 [Piromyces finnis]|nr:hypothetical protein BCR36DRAFT_586605 [Piromyces finnis]|eukprot:ORX43672.1 hypothetical protein BCR36DRAFT_586605 [Piromyces finnis]
MATIATIDNNNLSYTENGAIGYKTSGKDLLDINFAISSMRNMDESQIIEKYIKAFNEENMLAVKWLFYARDCRSGVGERRLFRICLDYLEKNHPEIVRALLSLIPEYGRWDDLFALLKGQLKSEVFKVIKDQLEEDKKNMSENKPISLCAKWMPSINTSSKTTRQLARLLINEFKYNDKKYRKMLSQMRSFLKVVEVSMSAKKWSEINYSAVPSRANLIYNKAFLKNDTIRRKEFLEKLKKGETKINSQVLFPHDIVNKYGSSNNVDDTLEELWKGLPDYVNGNGNTICVADSSGSMCCNASPNSSVTCMQVAFSLAVYFAERSSGRYKDKYITFSSSPSLVDLSGANTLKDKLRIINNHCYCSNTNLEAVFNLILDFAVDNQLPQEELPSNILILSDMEFDSMVDFGSYQRSQREAFFSIMKRKFKSKGYLIPRLVFWNINSRTGTIPVKENELGVALVSGFSPAIIKMVLSNKTDPFECLLEQLNSERYQPIEDALKDLIK